MKVKCGNAKDLFKNVKFTEEEEEEIRLEVEMIGEIIKARKRLNMTQTDISKKAGIPQSTIARIETNVVTPQISTIIKYLNAIDCRLKVVRK